MTMPCRLRSRFRRLDAWCEGRHRPSDNRQGAYHRRAMAPESIDAYLATLPADQRDALQRLRAQITRLIPGAEETISYGMPAFKLDGHAVVWFAGWKHHCTIYPLTDTFLASHADELKGYDRTKGSLHFTPAAPLPEALIESFVRARIGDLAGRQHTNIDGMRSSPTDTPV
jgi:uncharacterized protein YdhG (YjbR/CyaY superfamily)